MINNGGRDATLVGMISQAKANALSSGTTTSNVPEGTNLYFTSERARAVIGVTSPLAYNSSTGTVSLTQDANNRLVTDAEKNTWNNKANSFVGLTQDVTVVTQTTPSVLTSVLHFTNGVLTSIT